MRLALSKFCVGFAVLLLFGCKKNDEGKPVPNPNPVSLSAPAVAAITSKTPVESKSDDPIDEKSLPIRRQEILNEVERLIGREFSELSSQEWMLIKQHYWTPSLDQIIKENEGGLKGLLLTASKNDPLIIQVTTGKFTDVSDSAEQRFLVAMHLLSMGTASQGGASLPEAILDRSGDQQTTRGDVFMFEVLSDAFVEVPKKNPLSELARDRWHRLITSPNCLVRLLALRTFRRVEPDQEEWLKFYKGYLKEENQEILEEVTSLVFQSGLPQAVDVLSDFRSNCTNASPSVFVENLDRSLEWLKQQQQQSMPDK